MVEFQPVRKQINTLTDRVPSGPLGAIGEGDLIGFLGFVAVESGEIITIPIPGANRPGFKKVSHGMDMEEPGLQRHTIVIHAISKDVAEFVTQYSSAPSNFDFLRGRTTVEDVEELDTDSSYSTYRITILVDRRALQKELQD